MDKYIKNMNLELVLSMVWTNMDYSSENLTRNHVVYCYKILKWVVDIDKNFIAFCLIIKEILQEVLKRKFGN